MFSLIESFHEGIADIGDRENISTDPISFGLHRRHMGDGLLKAFVSTLESAPKSHQ